MLKLIDLLRACDIPLDLGSYKIHLATGSHPPALEAYFKGQFKEWQEHQTRRNFSCKMVVGLIEWSKNKWLFGGVYEVLGYVEKSEKHIEYQTELLSGQEDLIGHLVVKHVRRGRASYLIGKADGEGFYVSELLEKRASIEEFPGFDSVCIPFWKLKTVVEQRIESWHGALSNIKGVYLIADTVTGKFYVGSATGDSGIWQRWADYARCQHGDNRELVELVKMQPGCWEGFQFSILEIADFSRSDKHILDRESFWKTVLLSRTHGHNRN